MSECLIFLPSLNCQILVLLCNINIAILSKRATHRLGGVLGLELKLGVSLQSLDCQFSQNSDLEIAQRCQTPVI